VRVFNKVQHFDIVELDVQILVDRLQDPTNADVVLELNGDSLVCQGLEEAAIIRMSVSKSPAMPW
jgi:hypothetical protein